MRLQLLQRPGCPDDLLEAELVSTGGLAQPQTIKIIAAILEGSVIKKREEVVEGKKYQIIVSATVKGAPFFLYSVD